MFKLFFYLIFCVLADVIISFAEPITISGSQSGTLNPDQTYIVQDSLIIKAGDTFTVSPGDTLLMKNDPNTGAACWIHILGTFICDGTPTNHIVITTASDTKQPGMWGGIVGDSCKSVDVQYTEVSWAGGNNAIGHAYRTFDIYSDYKNTTNTVFNHNIVEGTVDDCIGLFGGNAEVKYNIFKWCGAPDGDNANIKGGCVGEIAYNVIWSPGGNGIKMTADPSLPRITNMCIHNNTICAGGWRRAEELGYGVLVDNSARAQIYNNIFGDMYGEIEITPVADTTRTVYMNNLFFYSVDSLEGVANYYPSDGVGRPQSDDIEDVKSSDLFVSYNAYFNNDYSALDGSNDYHVLSTSQAIGHGITPPTPTVQNHWGNPYFGNGTQTLPGDDNMGALGVGSATAINNQIQRTPSKFALSQNYPNPFNPSTNITYSLQEAGKTSIEIYNIVGQLVMTIDQGFRQAGQTYNVNINMDRFTSGVYFYNLHEGNNLLTRKMLLVK